MEELANKSFLMEFIDLIRDNGKSIYVYLYLINFHCTSWYETNATESLSDVFNI